MKKPTHHHPQDELVLCLLISLFFYMLLGGHHHGMVVAQTNTRLANEFKVGVVLDLDTSIGKMGLSCMSMAISDFYSLHSSYKRRLVLHTRDSNGEIIDAAFAAIDLMKNVEVQAIIGPITSSQANFMVNLGNKAHVPIISFSATSPSVSPSQNPFFIRTALNDSSQAKAISAIVKAFEWKQAIPIFEDTEFGNGIIPHLSDAFQKIDTKVRYRCAIPLSATDDVILKELYKLMTMQTRVFIVHMAPTLGLRVFRIAKLVGMMDKGYSWIITDGIANSLETFDSSSIESMQGVLAIRPYVPKSNEVDMFRVRWKRKFLQENPDVEKVDLHIFGIWAYDTIWALANAVENLENMNSRFLKPKDMQNSSGIGVSQIGLELQQEIANMKFNGLSGEFRLVDGQLQLNAFQILNMVDIGGSEIGFWTPTKGILRRLDLLDNNTSDYLPSVDKLRPVIWPGESNDVPKGWAFVTTERTKLRIGVPVKDGFTEYVKITRNTATNSTQVEGYSIDLFHAILEMLPYNLPYEFIPFAKADGTAAGSYDELLNQVFIEKYDAVVGDITIRANRSNYVDFTLPYTESGVSMIVPVKEAARMDAWIFLRPLTTELWLTSALFFVFTGFVIWVLEHRINNEFRGPRSHQ